MQHAPSLVRRSLRSVIVPVVLAAAFAGLAPVAASASTCVSLAGDPPANPGTSANVFYGVSVLSPCKAWAVGFYYVSGSSQTLIERWNGSSWTQQPSPSPGGTSAPNILES